ncbi:MAG TPA: DMT family transporter [Candidatus Eisenbacteria bacterium]|nr:DMT family transporter [Candidatus Eisenbacteria bacterium]
MTLVVWASGFAGIRHAGRAFPPASLALVRFSIASAVLAIAWWWRARARSAAAAGATAEGAAARRAPTRGEWARLALAGFLTIALYSTALNAGSRTVTAGVACLLVNLGPIFAAIGARIFLGERLGGKGWTGMLLAFAGVLLVARGMGAGFHWGGDAELVILAAVAQAAWFAVSKPLLTRFDAFETTCRTVWLGVLFLLPFAPEAVHALRTAPPAAIGSIVYLGVFPGALGYMTWTYVLSRLPASRAASLLYLVPPIAFTIAWLTLGETPTAMSLLGGIPIVAGVALVNSRQ